LATGNTKNILIAPLDWGLGHTARCVPIIRYIQSLGHNAIVAGNDTQLSFVRAELGDMPFARLEGYNIRYSRWNKWGQIGLLQQVPRIVKTIHAEHKWLQQHAASLNLDGIISDNRYGLCHAGIPSVILTHQLQVLSGFNGAADKIVQRLHYKYLNRFNETWVVDAQSGRNLGGKLSHPAMLPKQTKYLGLLSRFAEEPTDVPSGDPDKHLLVLLSGPEPLRTELSDMLWLQVQNFNGKVTFIEGNENAHRDTVPPHITYHKRLASDALVGLLRDCHLVICRSGYSTLMDLIPFQKKAILIPTPGQTEQEYLGKHLHAQGAYYCAPQEGFNLHNAMEAAGRFPFKVPVFNTVYGRHKDVLAGWLDALPA
jgi:hypothetical protein